MVAEKRSDNMDPDMGSYNKKVTGRELNLHEEVELLLL
jgi:hypothetical protein